MALRSKGTAQVTGGLWEGYQKTRTVPLMLDHAFTQVQDKEENAYLFLEV